MTIAYIFPGQGSQRVGMAKEMADAFTEARETLQEVDDALNQHLSTLMFEGPESDLTLTVNTQPAIMAASLAIWRVLEGQLGVKASDAAFVAGHSLGEYSALTAAGAFDVATAAQLLRTRGQAMQEAVPVGQGAMAAIIGLEAAQTEAVAKEASSKGVCSVANYNSPQQQVISGTTEAVELAMSLAKEAGAKRALPLPVSAPFHCELMAPAAQRMFMALGEAKLETPATKLMANVTAAPTQNAEEIKDLLVQQVTGSVRWADSIAAMQAAGVDQFVEVGVGKVLTGMNKRMASDAESRCIEGPADIDALAKAA